MRPHVLLLACLCALGVVAWAGDEPGYSRPGVLHLSLDSAIRMALARNYSILVARYDPRIAAEGVTSARGRFDPTLNLGASRGETSRRAFVDNMFATKRTVSRNDTLIDANLSGLTALGTQYRFGLTSGNATTSASNFLGNYASGTGLSLTQPLLRGFGLDANLFEIRISKNNVLVSEQRLRKQLIDTLTELVDTYNELHLAGENLAVAERSRANARQLFEDNTRRAAIGVMSPLDITTARAEVASREEGVILAHRTQLDNENLLKQLVTSDVEKMLSVRVEIERPATAAFEPDVQAGIRDALQYLPEYRQAILDLQAKHITVRFHENDVLPKLDLVGSLNVLGYENDFGSSLGRIGRRDSNEWTAGFQFSYPLGNRAAKGDLHSARLAAAQALVELQRQEQDIVVQVDNAAGQIVSDRARINSTTEASRLARESLDAGQQRLRAGTSTTFEVLELQSKLAEAEYAELRARSDYNKAVAEYYRKTGTALRIYRVQVD